MSVLLREFEERPDTDGAWVSRSTTAEVCKERSMHVYGRDKQHLLGATFTEEGKEFCIEEFGPRNAGDMLATARWSYGPSTSNSTQAPRCG